MKKLNENQKKFLGTVPKKYQLVETFWDCPEISKTSNKGITLIALIITIIVMLILVGVTINVALNGGLFGKAETAKTETNKAVEKEQLMAAVISAYDAKTGAISKETLETELGTGWQVTGDDGGPYTCTSPKGNKFTVDANETITEISAGTGETGWVDNGDGTFTKGDTTVEVGKTTYTNAELQGMLEQKGETCTEGTYTGTWTVIGVEGDKLKLVSTENVSSESVMLGAYDSRAIAAIPAADESNPTEKEKLERAIWSYNNAVATLDEVAQDETGIASARSIKIEDIYAIIGEKNVENDEYTYNYTNHKDHTFVNENGETVVIKNSGDEVTLKNTYYQYELSDEEKTRLGSLSKGFYWLASSCVECYSDNAVFGVRTMGYQEMGMEGYISAVRLFWSDSSQRYPSSDVRAVVSI